MNSYKTDIIEWLVIILILIILAIVGYYSLTGLIDGSGDRKKINKITTSQNFYIYIKDLKKSNRSNALLCKKAISLKIEYFDLKEKGIDCFNQYSNYKNKILKEKKRKEKEQELRGLFLIK